MLRDFGGGAGENRATATPPRVGQQLATLLPNKQEIANAPGQSEDQASAGPGSDPGKRLKRLNRAAQMNAIAMVQGPDGTPKFRCKQCNRVFNLRCTVLRHVRHQHEGRFVPHPCSQCGQVFKRTDHLKVHMRKIHNVTSSKRLKKESGELLDVDGMDEEEELENGGPSPTDMLSVSMVPIPTSLPPNSTPTTLAAVAAAASAAVAPTPAAIPVTTSADAAAYSAAALTLAQLAAQRSEQTNAVALALIANKQPESTPGLAHQ